MLLNRVGSSGGGQSGGGVELPPAPYIGRLYYGPDGENYLDVTAQVNIAGLFRTNAWKKTEFPGNPKCLAVTKNGTSYIGCDSGSVISYSASGDVRWNLALHTGAILEIVLDEADNVYTLGADRVIRMTNPDGTELARITGVAEGTVKLRVDGHGNLVTAFGNTVRKMNAQGTTLWDYVGTNEIISGVDVGQDGGIYVINGTTAMLKINSDGSAEYSHSFASALDNVVAADGQSVFVHGGNSVYEIDQTGNQVTEHPNLFSPNFTFDHFGNLFTPKETQDGSVKYYAVAKLGRRPVDQLYIDDASVYVGSALVAGIPYKKTLVKCDRQCNIYTLFPSGLYVKFLQTYKIY